MNNIEIKVVSPWTKPCLAHCIYDYQAAKYIIEVPLKASTNTKLHELGHIYNNGYLHAMPAPKASWVRIDRRERMQRETREDYYHFNNEINAELFIRKVKKKLIDWTIICQAVFHMVNDYDISNNFNWLFNMACQALKEHGIPFPDTAKTKLWWVLKNNAFIVEKLDKHIKYHPFDHSDYSPRLKSGASRG